MSGLIRDIPPETHELTTAERSLALTTPGRAAHTEYSRRPHRLHSELRHELLIQAIQLSVRAVHGAVVSGRLCVTWPPVQVRSQRWPRAALTLGEGPR